MDRSFSYRSLCVLRDVFVFISVDLKIEMGGYIVGGLCEIDL